MKVCTAKILSGKGINVSNTPLVQRTISPALIAGAMALALSVLFAVDNLATVLIAIVVTVILEPVVRRLEQLHIPRIAAVLLIITAFVIGFMACMVHIAAIVPEIIRFSHLLPAVLNYFLEHICLHLNAIGIPATPAAFMSMLGQISLTDIISSSATALTGFLSHVLRLSLLLFFMLYEFPLFKAWLDGQDKHQHELTQLFDQGMQSVVLYLGIRTLMGGIGGIVVWITLSLYHLQFAFEWAVIVFFLNYIPIVGSFLSTIPPLIQCVVFSGVHDALVILVLFVLTTIVMGCFIEPLLVGRKLALSLTLQMLSLLFWPILFGAAGVFLAIPLTVMTKSLLRMIQFTRIRVNDSSCVP